jgi:serine/threonine protein kinase/cytochrome c-type biogenesis protein CcmH/NrfG
MSIPDKLKDRYEIQEVLGRGGMGLVFRAWDGVVKRDVALKTLRDAPNRAALQLFFKECEVLAALSHPNIIEIFDVGEFEDDGQSKPFFVMPLLAGATLDKLIRTASHRLTVERVADIVCQACRGLQAAHERGLIHRDIKPSNLFVMDDDAVKIIDFGVAHMTQADQSVGLKGTLVYMAPEQLQMKPATPASDIYALGVVCYEVLTRRRPFEGAKESDIADSILRVAPPPVSDINPAVSQTLSRVVHKALAKQPWNRYSSAREFAETLQKALRDEPIEFFDPARIQPRIDRAAKAFEQGDAPFALEILGELEAEGHIDPAITPLRRQIEQAQRQKTIGLLLESARTRFEHNEYPLALQKIQEVLQLDPGNAPALGLKTSIENKTVTQKIEDWLRLARQHIDNQAYGPAREAIGNVLQLKPGAPGAAQLLSEIDRLEEEYVRARKEKESLYQAAQEAWNAGEVTTALSKMERVLELDQKAPETATPERAASYQSFYNKVRSEHESLKHSYAEARKHLADQNFAQALAIAGEWLGKYPGHALFQALKFDIEERQRQQHSARIAVIGRQVETEPDLDRRVHILEQAVAQFPGESHFERQVKPMREKRDLVNSIAAKARYHEERGQYAEALGQWEILGAIYGQYPGLGFEVERVTKKKDQQALVEAKARWMEQIERAVASGDFARALALAASADAEFPNDAELAEARQLAAESAARAEEAGQALAQGQALWQQQSFEDGQTAMRRALELEPKNPAIRNAVVETLVERARALVDSDWRAAEPLIQQALEIEPNHVLAKNLRITAQDHKRDEAVIRCFTQAREFRVAGDFAGALAEAEKCLAQYPLDPRLAQLRDILVREQNAAGRLKARSADLETLRQIEEQAGAAASPSELASILERARSVAAPYVEDAEFGMILGGLEHRLAAWPPEAAEAAALGASVAAAPPVPPVAAPVADEIPTAATLLPETLLSAVPPPPAGPEAPFSPTGMFAASGMPLPAAVEAQPAPPGAGPAAPPLFPAGPPPLAAPFGPLPPGAPPPAWPAPPYGAPGAPPPAPLPRKPGLNPALLWGGVGALAVAVLVLTSIFVIPKLRRPPPPTVSSVRVEVRTWPPGAVVRVNGKIRGTSNFQLEAEPGAYQIEAALEGYQPASTTAQLKRGLTAPVELTLQPLPQTVRLITDLTSGQVTLDNQAPRELQDGQVTIDAVTPGKHTLKLAGRSGQADFTFELVPGAVPLLDGPLNVKNVSGLIVSSFANRARVYATLSPAKVDVDGRPAGEAGAEGLQIASLASGAHELTVSDGRTQLKKVIEAGVAPVLTAFFQSDENIGTIVVLAAEDDVDVYIDGQKYRRQTSRGGQLRIPRPPRQYRVRVAKQGFQDVPEQVAEVRKGEEKRVIFNLVPLPTTAHLTIQGTPGAQVFIDSAPAGSLLADGHFQVSNLSPGEHTIELRKDRMRSHPMRRTFVAGQTVALLDSDVTLLGGPGTLRLNLTPASAQATVTRAGHPPQALSGQTTELDEGSYIVTASAPGYFERSERVQIVGGQTASLTLTLTRVPRGPSAMGMEGWEDAAAWSPSEGWYVRRGGGFVLYRPTGRPGVYSLTLMAASGGLLRGKNLEWVVGFRDPRNYTLFRLDKESFRRISCVNGRRTELLKQPHRLGLKDVAVTLQIEVTPTTVVTRAQNQGQWIALDSWTAPDAHFVDGRFGLLVEGRDEVRLSGFKFTPKE